MIRAVLWDLDGTLVDSEPTHGAAFNLATRSLNLDIGVDEHDTLLGKTEREVYELVASMGADITHEQWQLLKWKYYRRLAEDIEVRVGIATILDDLTERNTPMAVVSNSSRSIVDLNLDVTGLADKFTAVISRDDVVHAKPNPEGYLAACAALGCQPTQCLVIEDSVVGAQSGVAAGMPTIYAPQLLDNTDTLPPEAIHVPPHVPLESALRELQVLM